MKKPTSPGEPRLSPPAPVGSVSPVFFAHVPFYGGEIMAVAGHVEQPGDRPIPLRPICDRLGLALTTQLAKLRGRRWATVTLVLTVGADGRHRQMATLPLRALPMWLATINANRVAPGLRPMLEAYQERAVEALYQYFPPPAAAREARETFEETWRKSSAITDSVMGRPMGHLSLGDPDAAAREEAFEKYATRGELRALQTEVRALAGEVRAQGDEVRALDGAVQALAADMRSIKSILGLTPGVMLSIKRQQTADRMRLLALVRVWMQEKTRPLTDAELLVKPEKRGLSALEAADSFNTWAMARGEAPVAGTLMGVLLSDPALGLDLFRPPRVRSKRYGLQLLATPPKSGAI